MTDATTTVATTPAWVDLGTTDPEGARAFYGTLLGWAIEVDPDPQYGGYAIAKVGGQDAAGIGGSMSPDAPPAWSVYLRTDDAAALGERVAAAGGTVVMPAFDVGDEGRMAVFQDPTGAFISCWQGTRMNGFQTNGANAFSWAELNARGVGRAIPFYESVFGWTAKDVGTAEMPYTEFQLDGHRFAGATEISTMVPAEVPSYWMVYFGVDDVDAAHETALAAGGRELVGPMDFPGGRMSILTDPQGAAFGLMRMAEG
jgi:predicted enzyme related to lactoylglutathione lyase